MASNIKHLMTVADLDALPDDNGKRYELIEGELLCLTHMTFLTTYSSITCYVL